MISVVFCLNLVGAMLTNFIKLLFIVLLVCQSLETADAEHVDNVCRSGSGSCSGYCGTESDVRIYYTDDNKPPTGCYQYTLKFECSLPPLNSSCGCISNWRVLKECNIVCFGYCLDAGSIKEATRTLYKSGKEVSSFEGYIINFNSILHNCLTENKFPASCNIAKGWYRTGKVEDVHCRHEVQQEKQCSLSFHEETCQGCAYCDEDSVEYVDVLPGYQQAWFRKLEQIDGNYFCVPTRAPTGSWRCAAGYYKSADKTVADSTKEANIVCTPCPAGTYNANAGGNGISACTTCAAGATTFTESGGVFTYLTGQSKKTACEPCPVGYFEDGKKCKKCSEESGYKYQDEAGQTTCKDCPVAFIIDKSVLTISKTQCYIDPNIKLTDSLGTIDLKDEIGSATLYYVGP